MEQYIDDSKAKQIYINNTNKMIKEFSSKIENLEKEYSHSINKKNEEINTKNKIILDKEDKFQKKNDELHECRNKLVDEKIKYNQLESKLSDVRIRHMSKENELKEKINLLESKIYDLRSSVLDLYSEFHSKEPNNYTLVNIKNLHDIKVNGNSYSGWNGAMTIEKLKPIKVKS